MEIAAIAIEAFGLGSLTLAFVKYTLAKRKTMNAEDKMKNHCLNNRHNFNHAI
jgi:hypothetical protein